ncbi:uncharacterized protein I206_107026 [Kwoniella pini CBS 10737]|uniref:Uncharacterized protein n=1 Tax=Kwoniella pini CBS 10737 TaxID=1296096 RepID=A0A1B9HZJ2_9TREE|nr:uncharacterized protein I206_05431 [Kwoniella pini CBS 10737]OCF48651.1 hypothetical protein I206_05431 [Kwoniella pini CBS 10737]
MKIVLKLVESINLNQALLQIIKNQAKSLEEVRIGSSLGFPDEIGLEELIKDLPWSDFHHLKDLDICCRRNGDNTGIESVSSGQAAPSKSLTAAKGYGVKSVSISVYYPDAIQFSPSVNMKSERQIYRDLARCVAQLIDKSAIPGGPENWLHILQPASNPCEDPRASAHETTLKQAFIAEINGCLGMVN